MSKKTNKDAWRQRVQSLTGRITRGRQRLNAMSTLFGYLVKEMRKEDGNDEVIADLIEKIGVMIEAADQALTQDDLRKKPECVPTAS
ncbi:MAG: hypothetical protein ACXAEN_26280 [Candidatus Thorarchaeota archaeon]